MEVIGQAWNLIILEPIVNVLIVLAHSLFSSFGLAIIALTIVVNGCMYPLTLKQIRASKAMQTLQPKLAELQKKHAKDKEKLAKEQMQLYKESGVSPAGCIVPMLIQMPIWIALYQSIMRLLAVTPEDFLGLSQYLYSWPVVYSALPLGDKFLWLNLAIPDSYLVLPLLVGGTMWLQQKMITPTTADPKQQTQSKMMLWIMPLMFAFITLSFPSGLALFWVTSSAIRIVIQYFVTGWGGLVRGTTPKPVGRDKMYKKRIAQIEERPSEYADTGADIVEPSSGQEEGKDYGESGDKRQDRGRGDSERLKGIRRQPGRDRSHRPKRR
ncbi:MAG: membrane protein insertase YidC [Chloroflexi bacterium]|nr:membrane protein insertase YidC [Chloroflexota bacterium]